MEEVVERLAHLVRIDNLPLFCYLTGEAGRSKRLSCDKPSPGAYGRHYRRCRGRQAVLAL